MSTIRDSKVLAKYILFSDNKLCRCSVASWKMDCILAKIARHCHFCAKIYFDIYSRKKDLLYRKFTLARLRRKSCSKSFYLFASRYFHRLDMYVYDNLIRHVWTLNQIFWPFLPVEIQDRVPMGTTLSTRKMR